MYVIRTDDDRLYAQLYLYLIVGTDDYRWDINPNMAMSFETIIDAEVALKAYPFNAGFLKIAPLDVELMKWIISS